MDDAVGPVVRKCPLELLGEPLLAVGEAAELADGRRVAGGRLALDPLTVRLSTVRLVVPQCLALFANLPLQPVSRAQCLERDHAVEGLAGRWIADGLPHLEASLTRVGPDRGKAGPHVSGVEASMNKALFVLLVPGAQLSPSICARLSALLTDFWIALQRAVLVVGKYRLGR